MCRLVFVFFVFIAWHIPQCETVFEWTEGDAKRDALTSVAWKICKKQMHEYRICCSSIWMENYMLWFAFAAWRMWNLMLVIHEKLNVKRKWIPDQAENTWHAGTLQLVRKQKRIKSTACRWSDGVTETCNLQGAGCICVELSVWAHAETVRCHWY